MNARTHHVADVLVKVVGYRAAFAVVEALHADGFVRGSRLPALRSLRAAEIRRLRPGCDVPYHAARLGLRPEELRRHLRRRSAS